MNTQEFAEHLRRRTLPRGTMVDLSYGVVRAYVEDEKCTQDICDFEAQSAEEVLSAILTEFGIHVVSVAADINRLYGRPLERIAADKDVKYPACVECSVPTTEQPKSSS